MPSTNKASTPSYGTTDPEKGKLPFYRILSRTSTDSTRSTDALLQKETKGPKKDQAKNLSSKDIMNSKYLEWNASESMLIRLHQSHSRIPFDRRYNTNITHRVGC